jgi:hypothetical protein
MELIVDVANVMGSKPDGWWRDRAAAAARLLARLSPLVGTAVPLPQRDGERHEITIERIVAVVEGQAKRVEAPAGLEVVAAPAVGDDEIVAVTERLAGAGRSVLVVTADRGLRARMPDGVAIAGPGWLSELIGR